MRFNGSMIAIRSLCHDDFSAWLPLWDGNNAGVRKEDVTTSTWRRIIDPDSPVHGLGAFRDGKMLGLLHYVLHLTTGSVEPICYMQDVYTNPDHRRQGIAKALITDLVRFGKQESWNRIYWLAEEDNLAAQTLYEDMGVKLNFTLHIWPLGMLGK